MKECRYKNIFLFASPQFCGNIIEYFIKESEKLVVYITMPRFNNKFNKVLLYKNGILISEENVWSSGQILLYYILWYVTYIRCLMKYFSKKEQVVVITWQPFFFFAMSIQKLLRNVIFVYWIGDYFPPVNHTLMLYETVKKYYHRRVHYSLYLSDRINKKFNGYVAHKSNKKTVMWGVNPVGIEKRNSTSRNICFVGVIKDSQGIELLIRVMKEIEGSTLKILGSSTDELYRKYLSLITELGLQKKVYFPNKMFYGKELENETLDCFVGVALYTVSELSVTYYADPGKIKTYMQLHLPVIMTPIAEIEQFITKFHAGIVVERDIESVKKALLLIKKHYSIYERGVMAFNNYFNYESYYQDRFNFLEKIND